MTAPIARLEIREAGGETRLSGRFPYGQETVLSDGGPDGQVLVETFAPRAFALRTEHQDRNIYLLSAHDFTRPVASLGATTLQLTETDEALIVEARIAANLTRCSYITDMLEGIRAGLVHGLSPGFRVASIPGAETMVRAGNRVVRTISIATLVEISIVTNAAYPQATIEARRYAPGEQPVIGYRASPARPQHPINRWRR